MKFGMRKPSIKKSMKARTTGKLKRKAKGAINPLYGKKGMGWVRDPKRAGLNFTNSSEKDDKLAVEDLADRVTQTQLDEIKSHFDTKISNLDDNIKLHIKGELQTTITELKDYISEENNKLNLPKTTFSIFDLFKKRK